MACCRAYPYAKHGKKHSQNHGEIYCSQISNTGNLKIASHFLKYFLLFWKSMYKNFAKHRHFIIIIWLLPQIIVSSWDIESLKFAHSRWSFSDTFIFVFDLRWSNFHLFYGPVSCWRLQTAKRLSTLHRNQCSSEFAF